MNEKQPFYKFSGIESKPCIVSALLETKPCDKKACKVEKMARRRLQRVLHNVTFLRNRLTSTRHSVDRFPVRFTVSAEKWKFVSALRGLMPCDVKCGQVHKDSVFQ